MSFSQDNSVASVLKLVKAPIYSHCYSADRSVLAISCDKDCLVYRLQPQLQLIATLSDHDKLVTAVDISIHGRIVTCSQDRNAYVWEPMSNGTYKPTLVLLRINRAATSVSWAPNGYKFAVGSSARIIAVCYYEQENNWWVSKHIKKPIRSTVTCLSWHENGVLLAAGGTDGYLRIFSGFIKGLDSKEVVAGSPWGDRFPFGSVAREFYQGSYVHDLQWRSNQERIAFVAHDGTVNIADPQGTVISDNSPDGLPFKAVLWINDAQIICGGYSCHPVIFATDYQSIRFVKNLDKPSKNANASEDTSTDGQEDEENTFSGISALRKFKELDLKGKVTTNEQETAHENTIVEFRPYAASAGNVSQVSSCGLDGKIVIYAV